MLKLTKYEFIKSKFTLIIIGLILAVVEGYFLYSIIVKDSDATFLSAAFLFIFAMTCFFVIYIIAIKNYYDELSSKSSYLIFMTPTSSLSIILSKMLNVLIIGIILIATFAIVGIIDYQIATITYDGPKNFIEYIKYMLSAMDVDTALIIPILIAFILEFLINFYSIVTMMYLAITLSSTVLQDKRSKGIVSFILVILFSILIGMIEERLPTIYTFPANAYETVINILPTAIFEFFIMIGCIAGSATLLKKKVSL